jgi:sucrose-phosphate synthase
MHVSPHGRIRAHNPEIGIDQDTGGQTGYILQLARALGSSPRVRRMDLVTRLIEDPDLSPDYAQREELIEGKARIIRLPCGPKRYLLKEKLWRYMQELIDATLQYIHQQGELPDAIHGHYADGGLVATRVAKALGIPLIYTAHSLGRFKRERVIAEGLKPRVADARFQFRDRIEAEEETLENADIVVAGTNHEVMQQYVRYDHYNTETMRVIPPGLDIERMASPPTSAGARQLKDITTRFLVDDRKPALILLARPDPQKNVAAAVRSFAESSLREKANLILFIGLRSTLGEAPPAMRDYYLQLLQQIDSYDLYGSIAYPKQHTREAVEALYRLAYRTKGVLLAPSLHENFGLTLVEAAAAGVPVVSSGAGGMRDVMENCGHGLIVDPADPQAFAAAIDSLLTDRTLWRKFSINGQREAIRRYTWRQHVTTYLKAVTGAQRRPTVATDVRSKFRKAQTAKYLLMCDIDDTLTGDNDAIRAFRRMIEERQDILFGVATGRYHASAVKVLKAHGLPMPSILIASVGTRIYYNFGREVEDSYWRRHIQFHWEPEKIRTLLQELDWLKPQDQVAQNHEKISYNLKRHHQTPERTIKSLLRRNLLRARVLVTQGRCVDVIPVRASKGHALRYLSWRLGIDMSCILTAGDAGNDLDMLRGQPKGIVVANHSRELGVLRRAKDVYFSPHASAAGVLDGLRHYGVL